MKGWIVDLLILLAVVGIGLLVTHTQREKEICDHTCTPARYQFQQGECYCRTVKGWEIVKVKEAK